MEIWAVIRVLSLVVAGYALYRALAWNSGVHFTAHDVVHGKIVAALDGCDARSEFFLEQISAYGYMMTDAGWRSTQQEKDTFVAQLNEVERCITDQLLIDSENLWRFRIAARAQVVSRNRMWRDNLLRVRRRIFVMTTQHAMIDTNH
jgi:hypothetical protein